MDKLLMLRFSSFWIISFLMLAVTVTGAYAQDAHAQDAHAQEDNPAMEQNGNPDAGTAQLQVQISELQEQIRKLGGRIEEISYENKQLKAQLDKSSSDAQFRLDALEKKLAATATASSPTAAPSGAEVAADDSSQLKTVEPAPDAQNDISDKETPAASTQKFASSRDNYNYAFKLMNQAKYAEAGSAFAAFTQKYPKDPLAGNAWYWLGETYYVRHDYVKAADSFRQGYESIPTGPKAADNLLKLAMSLNALNKDKEACIVLKQVVAKFGASSGSVKPRAEQEINRIGCN